MAAARRLQADPPSRLAVWVVFTGCARAHQDGIRAFLSLRGSRMPQPVLVVGLADPARPPLMAVVSEGPLWAQPHRPTGPAIVERLRWAGVRVPAVDRAEPTDARAAMILGYRALAFCGGASGDATPAAAARCARVVENVARWFGEDLVRVADDRADLGDLVQPGAVSGRAPARSRGA